MKVANQLYPLYSAQQLMGRWYIRRLLVEGGSFQWACALGGKATFWKTQRRGTNLISFKRRSQADAFITRFLQRNPGSRQLDAFPAPYPQYRMKQRGGTDKWFVQVLRNRHGKWLIVTTKKGATVQPSKKAAASLMWRTKRDDAKVKETHNAKVRAILEPKSVKKSRPFLAATIEEIGEDAKRNLAKQLFPSVKMFPADVELDRLVKHGLPQPKTLEAAIVRAIKDCRIGVALAGSVGSAVIETLAHSIAMDLHGYGFRVYRRETVAEIMDALRDRQA